MEIIKTVTEHDNTENILFFVLKPNDPIIGVKYHSTDSGHGRIEVDVTTNIWPAMTATQKATVKGLFKAIAAEARGVAVGDITGDIIE